MTLEEALAAENRRYEAEATVAEVEYAAKLAPLLAAVEAARREIGEHTDARVQRGKANKRQIIDSFKAKPDAN